MLLRNFFRKPQLPRHQCVVDLDRIPEADNGNGTYTVTCAVAGCGRTMVIGRDIACLYTVAR